MKAVSLRALALLCAGAALLTACGQKAARPPKDFSHSDSVSVRLAKANWTDGLRQVEPGSGRATSPATVGGSECRCLKTPEKEEGFVYFLIDPSFKATNAHDVKVMVQYFDATQGSFTIEYDGQAGKYAKAEAVVQLRASLQWETAEFILRNARFDNLQDNNADFRLRIKVPEFFVRRVEVSRDTTPVLTDRLAPESVTALLKEPPVQEGLRLVKEADGKTTPAVIDGQPCHRLDDMYLYFAIDPAFKWAPRMRVKVEVELFDASSARLEVQYDAWSEQGTTEGAYKRALRVVQLQQLKQWRTETFLLTDARFENRENGRSDFRLRVEKPQLYIKRVTVSRAEGPEEASPPRRGAGSNVVSITFGKPNVPAGLEQAFEPDSVTWIASAGGQDCLTLRPAGSGRECYIYFVADPSLRRQQPTNFVLDVEYFAAVRPFFKAQFNGVEEKDNKEHAYKSTPVQTGPTNVWTTARFLLPNARFKGAQNSDSDFRLLIYTPSFYVRTVTLRY